MLNFLNISISKLYKFLNKIIFYEFFIYFITYNCVSHIGTYLHFVIFHFIYLFIFLDFKYGGVYKYFEDTYNKIFKKPEILNK